MRKKLRTKTTTIAFLLAALFIAAPAGAVPVDLTPDYSKKGASVDILTFDIIGPAGGTTLTKVVVDYTGGMSADGHYVYVADDVAYMSVYVSVSPFTNWTYFGWGGYSVDPDNEIITGSYYIPENVTARVKLSIKLKSTAAHGDIVDAKVIDYDTTYPPADGSDIPPIDPDGCTIIDTTEPEVAVTTPNGGEVLKGGSTYDIEWTAFDAEFGLANKPITLYYSTDGNTWVTIATNKENTGSYTWTLPLIDSDEVLVKVTATDLAGNVGSDVSDAEFTIDSTKPTISELTPANGSYTLDKTPTINATLADDLSGINASTIVMTVDGETVTPEYNPATGLVSYTPAADLDEGPHTVSVTVSDRAGNEATAEWSFTVIITYTPVVTSVSVEASKAIVSADGIDETTITATVKDQYGIAIEGKNVSFETNLGTLNAASAVTNEEGEASVTLTSNLIGTATVTATADSVNGSVDVKFISVAGISDVIAMLDDIEAKIDKLPDTAFIDAAKSDILTAISNAQSTIVTEIDSVKTEVLAIEAKLDNEEHGLAAIKEAIDKIDLTPVTDALDLAKTEILAAISDLGTKIDAIKAKTDTISWADILAIKTDVSEIKGAIAPPVVIEGTKTCSTGSVELFSVDNTWMGGNNPFRVSFTIDATELDLYDYIYLRVYVKATSSSSLVLAKQVTITGKNGADPGEVYIDSIVNAELVKVEVAYYRGTTSDDPIAFQAVLSSP